MTGIPEPRRRVPRPPMPGELYEDYRRSRLDVDNYNLRMENEELKVRIKRQQLTLNIFTIAAILNIITFLMKIAGRWLP